MLQRSTTVAGTTTDIVQSKYLVKGQAPVLSKDEDF